MLTKNYLHIIEIWKKIHVQKQFVCSFLKFHWQNRVHHGEIFNLPHAFDVFWQKSANIVKMCVFHYTDNTHENVLHLIVCHKCVASSPERFRIRFVHMA